MSKLRMYVLGPPRVEVDGTALDVDTRKATALLVYLALSDSPSSRSTLAAMFWPDYPTQRARANLRRTLSVLRSALAGRWLQIDGDTIDLDRHADLWIDMCAFRDMLGSFNGPDAEAQPSIDTLIRAAKLYRDDFMQGFVLKDCPSFDEWQFFLREALRQELTAILTRLVELFATEGSYSDAIKHAQRWVALDSSSETAHRALIQLYADDGQRTAALRQYRVCAQQLASELDAEPSVETLMLYQAIKSGRRSNRVDAEPGSTTVTPDVASAAEPHDIPDELRTVTVLSMGLCEHDGSLGQSDLKRLQNFTRKAQTIVTQYGGRVDRVVTGLILATFGVEKSHEDDPLRAVFVALALQALAKQHDLVIGVGIGTDLVYRTGRWLPGGGQSEISGRVIDLATRLQLETNPSQILVADTTYAQTRHAFTYALTPRTISYRQGSVVAYAVTGRRNPISSSTGVDGLNAAMIGRERELGRLQSALAQLLRGQGQIILVTGDAGVGKTRLIAEARQKVVDSSLTLDLFSPETQARQAGHKLLWLEGRCLEFGRNSSYSPIVDMLHTLLGWRDSDSDVERSERMIGLLRMLAQSACLREDQVDEISPLLDHLLARRFNSQWDDVPQRAAPEQIYHRTFAALCLLFEALSKWTPVALVFEDLHWSDGRSLDLIIHLMELVQRVPLLVLCTYRNDHQQRCWQLGSIAAHKCPDRHQELRLRELTPGQSHQLVNAYGIAGVDEPTKQLIVNRAQGNPLFLEEIVHSLIEHGALIREQSGWHARADMQVTFLSRRLQDISQGRVDQLEPALRRLVRRASVIGRVFSKRVLSRVMPANVDLDRGLAQLVSHTLIVQERALPEVEYAFKHVLIQEAICASIPAWRRTELHGKVAEAIEALTNTASGEWCAQLAFHYDRSEKYHRAVHYLVMAGHNARLAYLNDEAVQYFLRAQERLDGATTPDTEEDGDAVWAQAKRVQIETGLGQVYHVVGDDPRAARHFRRALALQQTIDVPLGESIRLLCWLGDVLLWQGQFEEVIDIGRQGVEILANDPISVEAALMYQTVAMAAKIRGNYAQFWQYTQMTDHFIGDLPYVEELMPAYVQIGEMHHDRGESSKAVQWAGVLIATAEEHRDLRLLAGAFYNLGCLHADMGMHERAIDHLRQAMDTYARAGDENQKRVCIFVLAHVLLADGQIDAAKEELTTLEPMTWKGGSVLGMAIPHSGNAVLSLCTGCVKASIEESERCVGLVDNVDLPLRDACARIILGRALLAAGNDDQAYRQFRRAITRCEPVQLLDATLNTLGWPFRPLRPLLVAALAGLEETFDDRSDFQRFCRAYRTEHPSLNDSPFRQWHLTEPVPESGAPFDNLESIPLCEPLPHDATWQDPLGDCHYSVGDGLNIHAANGRDLWQLNRSAPRVLWSCSENISLQSRIGPVAVDTPALGGLLLWVDEGNYLCLERGVCGPAEVLLSACFDGRSLIIGRGRLPGRRIWLRLERKRQQAHAYCSIDGQAWQGVGQILFPVHGSPRIGVYGIGNIDRTVYAGAFRGGSAVRFEELRMR